MTIHVEFFGIPRVRAGVANATVMHGRETASLAEVLDELSVRFPDFSNACISDQQLREGYVASIDGQCFVQGKAVIVKSDQSVLILSADAGG